MSEFFSTTNPATGEVHKKYQHLSWEQSQQLILNADADFHKWRKSTWAQRTEVLNKLANSLKTHKTELAQIMHDEMGKLLPEAKAEIDKCAATCEYYASEGPGMLKNHSVKSSPYAKAEVSFQPLGVIFSIMPWNFPLWQVIRFAAPALMAGNVILLKHADLTAGTGEILGKIFDDLTSDYKLLRNLPVDHDVASKIIAHNKVQGVTFTGSSAGGKSVAVEAAKNLKKIVLELGGSDPYLVWEDADIEKAAKTSSKARLQNCGQSCVAGKRFIVHKNKATEFTANLVKEMKAAQIAPLAHKKFQKQIVEQVEKLKSWGGEVVLGGTMPEGPGAFYPATVVVFKKDHPDIHAEEIFGPVASVIYAQDDQDALIIANSSPFGLGGGIFTSNIEKGREAIEKELQAGFVVVNDYVKSDPHLPFGGVKTSGYGRELGPYGIMEFVNIKTVAVAGE